MKLRCVVSAAVIALLTIACGGTSAPAATPIKQEVVMGFVPSQTTSIVQTNAALIADYLSAKTGYHVTGTVRVQLP